jgi:large subunit ribosomal protein L22
MQVKASLKNLRMSPRKVRLVTDLIRGMDVSEARTQLRFLNKKASEPIAKLLDSAIANAKNNFSIERDNLYIASIAVNPGSVLKRWTPRAFGRTSPIMKRTSHILLVLEEKKPTIKKLSSKLSRDKGGAKAAPVVQPPIKEETDEGFLEPEKTPIVKEKREKRPYDSSTVSKKRFFSRQTFGNLKKNFRRKTV